MVSGIEGVGEAVTGGLIARAVEPDAGDAAHAAEGSCLNCGTRLAGEFCHRCGQKGHVHRTLSGFWHDLTHSVFHFEGKIWRTLPMLAWRPGELTRRYVEGERGRFVSPIALFLFSVFLMFAVFTLVGGPFSFNGTGQTNAEARAEAERDFRREQAANRAELTRLRIERRRLAAARQPTTEIDTEIHQAERDAALQERLYRQAIDLFLAEEARDAEQARQEAAREGHAKQNAAAPAAGAEEGVGKIDANTGSDFIDHAIEKAGQNPSLLAYKLQTNAYKFSWALIPISVPFLWLLFLHRRRYRQYRAYDHTVFVTYSIAFMSLGLIALSLLRPLGLPEAIAGLAITFVPPIHIYRQLRGAYVLSPLSAIWRTAALIVFAFIAAMLFFLLLLTLGAFG
ncbi:MAG TPA: DUF3667 domain-containing protein [Allosphingosinicella sp.]